MDREFSPAAGRLWSSLDSGIVGDFGLWGQLVHSGSMIWTPISSGVLETHEVVATLE